MSGNDPYLKIYEKIERGPLGAPKAGGEVSQAFLAFLKLVYTPDQAQVVQQLEVPYRFKKIPEIAQAAGRDEAAVKSALDALAGKCAIIGINDMYCLPMIPMLLNNHQFYARLQPEDLEAAKLYQQFFIKEGFYKYYESSEKGTPTMRVIPVRRSLEPSQKILDTEEAHKIIQSANHLALVPCPCRTRTEKLGIRECKDKYPIGFCIMTNASALVFEKAGLGKRVTPEQAAKYFDEMQDLGLVGITENYQDKNHDVICLCCDCCCSQVRGRTRWENPLAVAPANFVPEANEDCILCGDCEERCFFSAITLDEKLGRAVADPNKCLGCGVCAIGCPQSALRLKRLERHTPFAGPRELYSKVAEENKRGKN